MSAVSNFVIVFFGAGLGGTLRHAVNILAARSSSPPPLGTFFINVVGSLAIGLVAGYYAVRGGDGAHTMRLFLATGVLGGFTTFSAFSLETVALLQGRQAGLAAGYVAGSVLLAVAGAWAGVALTRPRRSISDGLYICRAHYRDGA